MEETLIPILASTVNQGLFIGGTLIYLGYLGYQIWTSFSPDLEVTPVTIEEDNLATAVNKTTPPVDNAKDNLMELIDSMLENCADPVDTGQTPTLDTTIELNPILSIPNTSPDFMGLNTCYAEDLPYDVFFSPEGGLVYGVHINVINDMTSIIEVMDNYMPFIVDNLF